jgi:hypothetical protein
MLAIECIWKGTHNMQEIPHVKHKNIYVKAEGLRYFAHTCKELIHKITALWWQKQWWSQDGLQFWYVVTYA